MHMGFREETSRYRISYLTGGSRANSLRLQEDGLCVRAQHFHVKYFEKPTMALRHGGLFAFMEEAGEP